VQGIFETSSHYCASWNARDETSARQKSVRRVIS